MTEAAVLLEDRGPALLALVREAIASAFGPAASADPSGVDQSAPWLREKGACFVTLRRGGALRGCIGSIEARRSLLEDVRACARAAAFDDPRFSPLSAGELANTSIEVSLLSPLEPLPARSEAEALAQIAPMSMGSCWNAGAVAGPSCRRSGRPFPTPGIFSVSSS